jgi:hypothetical protein
MSNRSWFDVLEKSRQERGEEDDIMDKSVSEIFHHFIGRAVTLEDLQKLSSQMLVGFQQALEAFQRPPLHEASAVLAQVMASAPSERLDTYTDMGCRHVHSDHSVVIKCECFCSCCLF